MIANAKSLVRRIISSRLRAFSSFISGRQRDGISSDKRLGGNTVDRRLQLVDLALFSNGL